MIRRLTKSLIILLLIVGCDELSINEQQISDGTAVTDTLYIFNYDTLIVNNYDTLIITNYDTTIFNNYDTLIINNYDTLVVTNNDTIYIEQTISSRLFVSSNLPALILSIINLAITLENIQK